MVKIKRIYVSNRRPPNINETIEKLIEAGYEYYFSYPTNFFNGSPLGTEIVFINRNA